MHAILSITIAYNSVLHTCYNALLLFSTVDGCPPDRFCNNTVNNTVVVDLCIDWPESDISTTDYVELCPCGSLNDESVYNRTATRRCSGNFQDSRAEWGDTNFNDCIYTMRVLELCRLLNIDIVSLRLLDTSL